MKKSYFSREISDALKGIALILMFVHHFFTFPDWITCGVEYPWIQDFTKYFCAPTDICVSLFAFLTGYFYAFSRGKLGHSLNKITDFLLSYWLVAIPLTALAALTGCYTLSRSVVLELVGLRNAVMTFCWYVYFYCIVMLVLPVLARRDSRSPVMDVFVLLVVPVVVLNVWEARDFQPLRHAIAWNLRQWFPCVAVGFLFGRYGLFETWFDRFFPENAGKGRRAVVYALMVWAAFRGRYFIEGLYPGTVTFRSSDYPIMLTEDVIFAPLFLYGAANLLKMAKGAVVTVLGKIGRKSMLMWFYHCVFFNCCASFTQKILYFPRNPVLVLLNGLILCYLAAALTEPVRRLVLKWKNAVFAWFAGKLPVKSV